MRGETKVEGKPSARNTARYEGRCGNSRLVTHIRPEAVVIYARAGRSQLDSWWRPATSGGIFPLGDLGVGVIVLSNTAIASSSQNVSQHSVLGVRYKGRALIRQSGSERGHCLFKLRILYPRRRGQLGSRGKLVDLYGIDRTLG